MTLAFDRHGPTGAPVLVLLHGLGSSRQTWDPVLPLLSDDFDVVAVDLPGHGDSPPFAPGADPSPRGIAGAVDMLLASLLTRADAQQVHVAGSSLGGWVGLELARRGRAESVTALAPAGLWAPGLVPVVAHANRWAARLTAPMAPVLLRNRSLRAFGFWTASAHPGDLDPQVAIDAARAHAGARGWAAALTAAQRTQFDPEGFPDDVPVTIVWGDRDRILPRHRCQELASAPAQARWVRLSDCGHVPMWDQPATSAQLIRQTVKKAVAAPGSPATGPLRAAPPTTRRAAG